MAKVTDLLFKTVTAFDIKRQGVDGWEDSDCVVIATSDGCAYVLHYHGGNSCGISPNSITGNEKDFIGQKILQADESINVREEEDGYTVVWRYYKLRSVGDIFVMFSWREVGTKNSRGEVWFEKNK